MSFEGQLLCLAPHIFATLRFLKTIYKKVFADVLLFAYSLAILFFPEL